MKLKRAMRVWHVREANNKNLLKLFRDRINLNCFTMFSKFMSTSNQVVSANYYLHKHLWSRWPVGWIRKCSQNQILFRATLVKWIMKIRTLSKTRPPDKWTPMAYGFRWCWTRTSIYTYFERNDDKMLILNWQIQRRFHSSFGQTIIIIIQSQFNISFPISGFGIFALVFGFQRIIQNLFYSFFTTLNIYDNKVPSILRSLLLFSDDSVSKIVSIAWFTFSSNTKIYE